jgi:hypothetical protein
MKRVLCTILLASLTCAPALAIPGQTPAQVLAWGTHNRGFDKFVRANDDEVGGEGYEFFGTLKIDGHDTEFHALPHHGIIAQERVTVLDVPNEMPKSRTMQVIREILHKVYGPTYERDFANATRIPNTGTVTTIWRGARLGYMEFGGTFFVVRNSDLRTFVVNTRRCGALDCSPDP